MRLKDVITTAATNATTPVLVRKNGKDTLKSFRKAQKQGLSLPGWLAQPTAETQAASQAEIKQAVITN